MSPEQFEQKNDFAKRRFLAVYEAASCGQIRSLHFFFLITLSGAQQASAYGLYSVRGAIRLLESFSAKALNLGSIGTVLGVVFWVYLEQRLVADTVRVFGVDRRRADPHCWGCRVADTPCDIDEEYRVRGDL
jgi:hypothetical protein